MSPYARFKHLLVDYALRGKASHVALVAMEECGLPCKYPNGNANWDLVQEFLEKIKVPPYTNQSCSHYLAMHYPNTWKLFCDGKDTKICYAAIMKEKKRTKNLPMQMSQEFAQDSSLRRRTRTIFARNRTKKSDWRTVK